MTEQHGPITLHHGDCLDVLRELPDASVDAVVTDPPYGLEFMGREWDGADGFRRSLNANDAGRDNAFGRTSRTSPEYRAGQLFGDWCEAWATECLRVLKPGGHMLAFGGTRTWHRLACAVEDAGFEVRDSIAWLYGSGFPKSLDVSKAIDKDNGRKFEDRFALGRHIRECREELGHTRAEVNRWLGAATKCEHYESDSPGFARVPTLADWHILRERLGLSDEHLPLVERVAAEREVIGKDRNWGAASDSTPNAPNGEWDLTAPATPDAARWQGWGTALKPAFEPVVVARKPLTGTVAANVLAHGTGALNIDGCRIGDEPTPTPGVNGSPAGRWPANVILDDHQAAELDQQSGDSASRIGKPRGADHGDGWGMTATGAEYDDQGGASRFFYVAKAPTTERVRLDGTAHPTVKPLGLMRWLVRLVTPPGGTVLEPFAGSGTTAEACLLEGFRCIAIEREADYLPLIRQRLNRRRDPVEAVKATGDELGLFDLLDGDGAA